MLFGAVARLEVTTLMGNDIRNRILDGGSGGGKNKLSGWACSDAKVRVPLLMFYSCARRADLDVHILSK